MTKRALVITLGLMSCGPTGAAQSTECARWIACYEALPGSIKGSQDSAYGPDGTCWKHEATVAATCTENCNSNTMQRAMDANAPAACK